MKNQLMIFPREGWTFFCTRARAHLGVWPLLLLLLTPQLRNWTFQYDLHKKVNLMPIFSRQAEFSWSAPRILVTTFFGQCIFHVMLVFFFKKFMMMADMSSSSSLPKKPNFCFLVQCKRIWQLHQQVPLPLWWLPAAIPIPYFNGPSIKESSSSLVVRLIQLGILLLLQIPNQ